MTCCGFSVACGLLSGGCSNINFEELPMSDEHNASFHRQTN